MTTSPNIAAELRVIRDIAKDISRWAPWAIHAERLRNAADALEAQQAAPTDLTEWQRELMRLVESYTLVCASYWEGIGRNPANERSAIESHAAQMVQRVTDLQSRCEAAEKDALRFEWAMRMQSLDANKEDCGLNGWRHAVDSYAKERGWDAAIAAAKEQR